MGVCMSVYCLCRRRGAAKYEVAEDSAQPAQQPPVQKPRLDPKDYMFSGLKGEVQMKLPGSIDGQGFIIDNCEDCDLYIFDHIAQITIDDCVNCRFFIGPVTGSMFMRDCKGCQSVMICRQFRTRECHECDFQLLCSTRPIIESSTKIKMGCYDLPYRGLSEHMAKVKMNFFQNHWSHIYDFTPKPGNWEFLPQSTTSRNMLAAIEEASCVSGATDADVPLVTLGEREVATQAFAWALFPPSKADAALTFAREVSKQFPLLRTNAVNLTKEQATEIAAKAGWDAGQVAKAFSGAGARSVGIELTTSDPAVTAKAEAAGALITLEEGAAQEYRFLGIEG